MEVPLNQQATAALRKSEERFRILIESVKDYAIFILDQEGMIVTWNQGAKSLKGYESTEIIGKHFSIFYSAEEVASNKADFELKVAREKGRFEEEGWRIRKDRTQFWANVIITPLFGDAGDFIGFAKVTRDLTERKNAENILKAANDELQRSRSFLDSMIENIPQMVFVKDAEQLRFVRFNRAGEELLGRSRKDLIGKNDYDFFPPTQADFFTRKDRLVLQGKGVVDIPEESIHTDAHGTRILHTRKIPILDASGNPEYLLGISEDITEWKAAEAARNQALREQAALEVREITARRMIFLGDASTLLASSLDYKSTLQRLAEMVLPVLGDWCTITRFSEDGTYENTAAAHRELRLTPLLAEIFQYYPVESQGENSISKVLRDGISQLRTHILDAELVAQSRDSRHLEILRTLGCVSSILVPLRLRGKNTGVIAFVSADPARHFDEEDLRMAEELGRRVAVAVDNALLYEAAQKAIRVRDEFLSIASHELKTPITSLKLQLQMARRNTKPDENIGPTPLKLAKVLDVSNAQVTRLTALIDDLLDISRIESGKLSYQFERIDLSALVIEIAERYTEHLSAAGCTISIHCREFAWISGDRFRLEQVLINLLSNAGKYGAGNPVTLSVTSLDEKIELRCLDHGMGIPTDKLEKVFERFERVFPSQGTSGLGLGLYITRQIVEAHQGTIRVESELGKGSTFIVEFPRCEPTSF